MSDRNLEDWPKNSDVDTPVLKRSPALIDSPAIQRNSALAQLFQPTVCYKDTRPDLDPDGQALTLTVPQLSRMIRSNGNTSETKCWFR